MIDVAFAIDAEAITVTRERDAAGSYTSGGKFVEGASVSTSIRAAVQPAVGTGRKLMDMPEGVRDEAKFIAWSRTELRLEDRLIVAGIRYKIIFVWPRAHDGVFWRAALGQLP